MTIRYHHYLIPVCAVLGVVLGLVQGSSRLPADSGRRDNSLQSANNLESAPQMDAQEKFEAVDIDLPQALREASLYASRLHRREAMRRLIERLGPDEMPAVFRSFKERPGTHFREHLSLMEIWAEKDPEAAAAYADTETNGNRERFWQVIAKVWGRKDPATALARVMALPKQNRLYVLKGLAEGFFEGKGADGAALVRVASATAAEMKGQSFGPSPFSDIVSAWVCNDPVAASHFVTSLEDEELRSTAINAVLIGWARVDPRSAVEQFAKMQFQDNWSRMDVTEKLAAALAEKDVVVATEFAQSQPEGATRSQALGAIAASLLGRDRDAAFALVENIAAADSYGLVYAFYPALGEVDPVAAIRHYAQRLDAFDPADPALKEFQRMFDHNIALQDGNGRFSREVAEFYAKETSGNRQALLTEVVSSWALHDSGAALAWAEGTEGDARNYAFIGLMEQRALQSIEGAVEWLQTLPKDQTYSAAVQGFANAAFLKDPDGALAWLRTIPDPVERQNRLQQAWIKWAGSQTWTGGSAKANREAAQRWRDTSPDLTPQERQGLVLPERK